jgi:hypothetical protein
MPKKVVKSARGFAGGGDQWVVYSVDAANSKRGRDVKKSDLLQTGSKNERSHDDAWSFAYSFNCLCLDDILGRCRMLSSSMQAQERVRRVCVQDSIARSHEERSKQEAYIAFQRSLVQSSYSN